MEFVPIQSCDGRRTSRPKSLGRVGISASHERRSIAGSSDMKDMGKQAKATVRERPFARRERHSREIVSKILHLRQRGELPET